MRLNVTCPSFAGAKLWMVDERGWLGRHWFQLKKDKAMRPSIDPVDYVRKFCSEMGIPVTGRQSALASRVKSEVDSKAAKRRLFLRMYQFTDTVMTCALGV